MQTFRISDVKPAARLPDTAPLTAYLGAGSRRVEAWRGADTPLVHPMVAHGLLGAADMAFRQHRPAVFSPDHFWTIALQGLSTHLGLHPDILRGNAIRHEGQKRLQVHRDDLRPGAPPSDWESVLTEFTMQIREDIGPERYRDLMQGFSTTGPVERTVYDISLLAALQPYYAYDLHTLCGIPEVTLEGTREDWVWLQQRIERFADYGLGFWVERVRPLLAEFVRVFDGHVDRDHWCNLYKMQQRSGEPLAIDGWLGRFLPYLRGGPNLADELTVEMLPASVINAGFQWHCMGRLRAMQAVSGLVGTGFVAASGAFRPVSAWAIVDLTAGEGPVPQAEPVLRDYFNYLQLPEAADDDMVRARVQTLVENKDRPRCFTALEQALIGESWRIFRRAAQRAAYRRLRTEGRRAVDLVTILEAADLLPDYYALLQVPQDANAAEVRLAVCEAPAGEWKDDALAILTTPPLRTHYDRTTRRTELEKLPPYDIFAPAE